MTGPEAEATTAARYCWDAAHTLFPYLAKYGVGSTVARAFWTPSMMSFTYCW